MATAFLPPKTSSRRVQPCSLIGCSMDHMPSIGSAKQQISTRSMFENGMIVKKSGSIVTTQKQGQSVSKKITKDQRKVTSFVGSVNMIPTLAKIESCPELQTFKGLGIVDFLKDKNFLITGATGFLGKVLIEKILRMQPQVGKVFVLIKAKDYESSLHRLKNEVICSDLFKYIQETHGNEYEQFMLKKVVPFIGDITEHNLGIQPEVAHKLSEEVDIVFNCAGNTTFDERYDVALEINTKGTRRLLEFAKGCERLKLFLQISTAYVNGQRQGRVLEKPFQMGDTIVREHVQLEFRQSSPFLDIEDEFELTNKIQEDDFFLLNSNGNSALDVKKQLVQTMKCLGMERAQKYGWQDTYVFTKAMGEMLIDNGREDLPVVIVRPSVIESTYSDPFPGWIEGNRMMDPIILLYGKGQLSCFLADPNGVLDVVPADMVVNATLAAMAKHAGNSGLKVYQVGSSVANPLRNSELVGVMTEHFKSNPFVDGKGKQVTLKKMQLFRDEEEFSTHMCSHVSNMLPNIGSNGSSHSKIMLEKREKSYSKFIEQAKYLAKIYKPYTFYQGRFDISNTEGLLQELSEEEEKNFGFDVRRINWIEYLSKTHIPGLLKHVMKGRRT